jgi:selenocysteine lyase/cysteine desulfurase
LTSPAEAAFLAAFPDYALTRRLDEVRASDFVRLDASGTVYLDYTGGGLYASRQLTEHAAWLAAGVFGNPHSANGPSSAATARVEAARHEVLDWFGASPDVYTAIFTANASAAIKLVGEAYPFSAGRGLLLSADNHNSANGLRVFAAARGAAVTYAPLTVPDLRIDPAALTALVGAGAPDPTPGCGLFVFPAQSNFSGVKHPLAHVAQAKSAGWDVLLDAAAFVPTNRLNLAETPADFVSVSFYKMFGYPTGVGCLIARKDALARLARPWFAGGTVNFATVAGLAHLLAPGEAGFEDGTLNYLSIPAVLSGLALLREVGMETVGTRVRCLTAWVLQQLLALRHGNGRPMVRLYGPVATDMRGGTITFNLYDPDGHLLDYRRVEELASAEGIALRTGCFCNPGAGEAAEGLTAEDVAAGLAEGAMTLPRFMQVIQHRGGKSAGAIRASIGLVSTFEDVRRFLTFLEGFRDQAHLALGDVTFDIESCRVIRDGA